jgi:16S rRNA (guanine527-N7)-methyltransferase
MKASHPPPPPTITAQLATYATLLRQWNPTINLVAPSTLAELEERHITDSAQLADYLPKDPRRVLDVGTGAGLPGLVLAIVAPQHTYTLVESDARKCAFLHTAKHELALPHVSIHNLRIENLATAPTPLGTPSHLGGYDIVTARAFAPLPKLLALTQPYLAPQGSWWLLKGQAVDEELRACETTFPMTIQRHPSKVSSPTSESGWVINLSPRSRS